MSDIFVAFTTNLGRFTVDLYADAAPQTVQNFLSYIPEYQAAGNFLHRLASGFVLQGGGYRYDGTSVSTNATHAPVVNEFSPSRSNTVGTIAMAKLGGDPNSATDQFFFNLADNSSNLDSQNGGFTVFGKVIAGWNVVQTIAALPILPNGSSPFDQVPVVNYTTGSPLTLSNLVTFSVAVIATPLAALGASGAAAPGRSAAANVLTGAADMIYGDALTVTKIHAGAGADQAIGSGGLTISGTYGHVTILPGGSAVYTVDASLPANQVFSDDFVYTVADQHGLSVTATLHYAVFGATTGSAIGSGGAEIIIGGGSANVLTGNGGADIFAYTAASDSPGGAGDLITDFATGVDKIDLSAVSPSGIGVIQSGASSFVFVNTPGGAMQINVTGDVEGPDLVAGGTGITLQGDGAATALRGTAFNDTIFGNGGNDLLVGGLGIDTLFGGAGADTFQFASASQSNAGGPDLIADFQTGVDKVDLSGAGVTAIGIVHAGGNSLIFANTPGGQIQLGALGTVQGSDITVNVGVTIQGGAAATQVKGGALNDTLFGEGGNDQLIGGLGADVLWGGAGADTFSYFSAAESNAAAPDLIADFQTGIDKIDLTGTGVTAIGIASNILFGSGPGGIAIQIGSLNTITLSDIIINSAPAPAPLFASHATHGMDGAMF